MWSNGPVDRYDPQAVEHDCTRLCSNSAPDQRASTRITLEHGPGTTTHREVPIISTKDNADDQAEQNGFEGASIDERDMHIQQVIQLDVPQSKYREKQN